MKAPSLDVVIVSYRSRDLLRSCLISLGAHPPERGARIWVVDNASQDGTPEMVRSEFPEVELIDSETNLGFSAANNLAIRRGRPVRAGAQPGYPRDGGRTGASHPATRDEPDDRHRGCRLVREDGTFDHAARRSFPTPLGALGSLHGPRSARERARLACRSTARPSVDSGPVDAVNGAFMLMRRAALEDVGLFDEGYWMYMEDLDLCYRFAEAGWTTWYEPSVSVLHVKGGSSGRYRSPAAQLCVPLRHVSLLPEALRGTDECGSEPRRVRGDRREARRVARPKRRSPSSSSGRATKGARRSDGSEAERELAAPATATL